MSKQVTDRERSTGSVDATMTTYGAQVAASLAEMLAPYAAEDGGAVPDVERLFKLLRRLMTDKTTGLVKADAAVTAEMADDDPARAQRDGSEAALRERTLSLRNGVATMYGNAGLSTLAMTDTPAAGPLPLKNYASSVIDALRKVQRNEATLTPLRADEPFKLGVDDAIASLAPHLAPLEAALKNVDQERIQLQEMVMVKGAALSVNDLVFLNSAGVFECCCAIAGFPRIAERVRPSTRTPGVLQDENPDPIEGGPIAGPAVDPAAPRIEPGMPGSSPFRD